MFQSGTSWESLGHDGAHYRRPVGGGNRSKSRGDLTLRAPRLYCLAPARG